MSCGVRGKGSASKASSVGNGCGRPWVLCCIRVSMGWGTSFGSDLMQALTLCLSGCYVTPRVTPFAQTHPPAPVESDCFGSAGNDGTGDDVGYLPLGRHRRQLSHRPALFRH